LSMEPMGCWRARARVRKAIAARASSAKATRQ
jgi:hypothetical protein